MRISNWSSDVCSSDLAVIGTQGERNMRTVVVGASSGLGRCIGVGLAQRGSSVALMARRLDNLKAAAEEAGPEAYPIECDVPDSASCYSAIHEAVAKPGRTASAVNPPASAPLAPAVPPDHIG